MKPTIFITNDDGYQAKGINELIKALAPLGKLVVMAPEGPRSCMSGAFTAEMPIHYSLVRAYDDVEVYSCVGTPVDCVKLAMNTVLKGEKPALVVSGINHGTNVSVCVQYSGTVAAAAEGCIFGVPALAVSLTDFDSDADFSESCRLAQLTSKAILDNGLPEGTFLNLNVPVSTAVKGIKVCTQAHSKWEKEYKETQTPKGKTVYWSTGHLANYDERDDNDIKALNEGYASLVPTKIDRTNYEMLSAAQWLGTID